MYSIDDSCLPRLTDNLAEKSFRSAAVAAGVDVAVVVALPAAARVVDVVEALGLVAVPPPASLALPSPRRLSASARRSNARRWRRSTRRPLLAMPFSIRQPSRAFRSPSLARRMAQEAPGARQLRSSHWNRALPVCKGNLDAQQSTNDKLVRITHPIQVCPQCTNSRFQDRLQSRSRLNLLRLNTLQHLWGNHRPVDNLLSKLLERLLQANQDTRPTSFVAARCGSSRTEGQSWAAGTRFALKFSFCYHIGSVPFISRLLKLERICLISCFCWHQNDSPDRGQGMAQSESGRW